MPRNFPESDWKKLRVIHEETLNRLCQRILDKLTETASDPSRSAHERYLECWKIMRLTTTVEAVRSFKWR